MQTRLLGWLDKCELDVCHDTFDELNSAQVKVRWWDDFLEDLAEYKDDNDDTFYSSFRHLPYTGSRVIEEVRKYRRR